MKCGRRVCGAAVRLPFDLADCGRIAGGGARTTKSKLPWQIVHDGDDAPAWLMDS